jgi:hypothetical protein
MFRLSVVSLSLLVLILWTSGAARAQIPDVFTNLQVLSPEIPKRELVGTMRDWTSGLGVRCNHCHVGPDNLEGMDFASDEKATKLTARRMLEMSRAINGDLLADLPVVEPGQRAQIVSCYTCHRGQPKPPGNIVGILGQAAAEAGIDSALARYDELRGKHYGAGVYDFSESALGAIAGDLMQAGRAEDAIRVLRKSLEYYPESAVAYAMIGMVYVQNGDPVAARPALKRALELDPENRMAVRTLQHLESTDDSESK